jgi:uncharacterized protein (TIGR03790 family)
MKFPIALAIVLLLGGVISRADEPSPETAATIVLYNATQPESLALAKYYAAKRAIPAEQLIGLSCSGNEEISRDAYLVTIEAPLRAAFTKAGWWRISVDAAGRRYVASAQMRFVAIMRGVPLKIASTAHPPPSDFTREIQPGSPMEVLVKANEASVDSELSALFALREELPAFVPNPYYRRFTPILQVPPNSSPLLVCRLDGPSDAIVRRMIDDSLATERKGLWGWAYLDARGIKTGPYAPGDEWITVAGKLLRRQGVPVISDYAPETLPEGFSVTDAAIYYGWYASDATGPFATRDAIFVPGAVAVHLHSFSARTLRDPNVAWAAPLLRDGADATLGNVYEPYLELTAHFDVMQDRLMNGFTLAESAYAAVRGLSWMGVVIGDPLYRPYAAWLSLAGDSHPPNIWEKYRAAVLAAGDPVAAAPALRQLAAQSGSSMPLEALGQAQAAAGDIPGALKTLKLAAAAESKTAIRFRITLEQIEILRRVGRVEEARARITSALGEFSSSEAELVLGRLALQLGPPPASKP